MSVAPLRDQLKLPATLAAQLLDFRRRVWTIKLVEAVSLAVLTLVVGFFCIFTLDRFWDTPSSLRLAVFLVSVGGLAAVPLYLHRWIWRHRRLEQLARLLSRKLPLGDELLGVIELARSETEQARSRALCAAAIQQVARRAEQRDFREAAPNSRHRLWSWLAAAWVAAAVIVAGIVPSAAANAWLRFLASWRDTPRYTFAAVEALPNRLIVAHGEPFTVFVRLKHGSLWRPQLAEAQLGVQHPVKARLRDDRYEFELPAQIDAGRLNVRVGDSRRGVHIEPVLRPELTSIVAHASLPEYLNLPAPLTRDVRGGSISLVNGSRARFDAAVSRTLSSAKVDGRPQTPAEATISTPEMAVAGSRVIEFEWRDEYGLTGTAPFTISIDGREDEAPSLVCEDLPRQKVLLDSEQIGFQVKAQDDFGVKQVGMEWKGLEQALVKTPAEGERILAAGASDCALLEARGTFSARMLGIEPQPIELRIFAEDYFPGRERVYSPAFILYVLNPEDHAIWMTEQLSKWHRQSLEVRDRELQLYETNRQLRDLPSGDLDRADTRRRIQTQAAAERANGRRLSNLTASGEDLIRQASRNPEIGVGHLEKWAEMLQVLKDVSANRMPSVADLLKQASQAKTAANPKQGENPPMAGQVRAASSGSPGESDSNEKKPPAAVPQIVDVESTQQPPDEASPKQPSNKTPTSPSLGLPTTTLIGGGPQNQNSCPAGTKMEQAVREQQELLAEFEKIADELNTVLANLEGSTLVKRLKAASREQYKIAGRIVDQLDHAFGLRPFQLRTPQKEVFGDLSSSEAESSRDVSLVMDDMQSYFERRRFINFKTVLEDMKQQDVLGALRQLGDDIPTESGVSIAQCEYWSDTLDRWAEDLVDPACGGT